MSETTPGETPVERRLAQLQSGIVSIQRDPHGRFWRHVAVKAAADAAIQRAQGRG